MALGDRQVEAGPCGNDCGAFGGDHCRGSIRDGDQVVGVFDRAKPGDKFFNGVEGGRRIDGGFGEAFAPADTKAEGMVEIGEGKAFEKGSRFGEGFGFGQVGLKEAKCGSLRYPVEHKINVMVADGEMLGKFGSCDLEG